jgi:uroporphyrinogen-III synthase
MLDRAAGNLMRLITVRPVGADVEGDDPAARVARAEAKLAGGDLAGAIAELEGLEGAAAAAAAPWLEQARARLVAEQALDRLNTHTAGLLVPPQ